MMNREEYRAKKAEEFTNDMMSAYGQEGEAQHNANMMIVIKSFLEDTKYSGDWTINNFATYASDPANLDKFIAKGAVIL